MISRYLVPITPLLLATFLYLWQSYNYSGQVRWGMVLTFIGYSVANIGLIIDFYEGMK